ncbi:MAG: hypothetical protein Q9166_004752 [cf. Caloplaca sp. 2 TL-2023]
MPQLQSLVEREPYAYDINGSIWIDSELEGDITPAYCVPFLSLCNIQVLELTNCSDFVLTLKPALEVMQQTHHRLKEVGLFGDHDERGQQLELLTTFAEIQSVRKIYGFHITGDRDNVIRFPYKTHCLFIEEIHFECSGIDGYCFEKLLDSCKALKIFYYENERSINEGMEGGPRRTIFALLMNAQKTLESLTLVDPSEMELDEEDDGPYCAELCDFWVLKHIAIECSIFVDENSGDAPLRLVDTLPPSLETLELYRPRTESFLNSMFLGLQGGREERLPKLRSISIQTGVKINDVIKRAGEALGIQLASVDAPEKRWLHVDSS